jgi:MoaA/NifB/PqqE/SkfB family radical SAM enzyme
VPECICVVPWSNLVVQPDGCANFCCDAPELLTVDGRLGNLGQDTLDDLWNSDGLVETRAAMARGERPAVCKACWDREDRGVTSRRNVYNGIYRDAGGELDIANLAQVGADSGFRLDRPPDWFVVELGSVCNLRCRSCGPLSSSSIAADPLHSAWNDSFYSKSLERDGDPRRAPSGASRSAWFTDIDELADMIASGARGKAMLSLMGGEPFLIKQTWALLEALVERDVAHNIFAGISTNGQHRSRRVAELAPAFRGFNISISVDGYGPLYEYLRHGASWSRLVENLDWFQDIANVMVAVTPTLQNTNALDMVRLVSFLEDRELHISYNAVDFPDRLRPSNLPTSIRHRAAARLREYLATGCSPNNAGVIRAYCERLESPDPPFDGDLFDEFLAFTRDLDASRGQSLAEAAPELAGLLEEEGIRVQAA